MGKTAANLGADFAAFPVLEGDDSELKEPFLDAWAHKWNYELIFAASDSTFSTVLKLLSDLPGSQGFRQDIAPDIAEIAVRALRAGDEDTVKIGSKAHILDAKMALSSMVIHTLKSLRRCKRNYQN